MLHNALLSAGSGLVLALMLEEVSLKARAGRLASTRPLTDGVLYRSFPSFTTMASFTRSVTLARGLPASRPTTLSTTL